MIYATFKTVVDGRPMLMADVQSADRCLQEHVVLTSPEQIEREFSERGVERVNFYFGGFPRRATTREKAARLYPKMFRLFDPTPEQAEQNERRRARQRAEAGRKHAEFVAEFGARDWDVAEF